MCKYYGCRNKKQDGWIPVSERLPIVGLTVLCYWEKMDRYSNITNYYYTLMHRNADNVWISDFGQCTGKVLAWQELKPYRRESNANRIN